MPMQPTFYQQKVLYNQHSLYAQCLLGCNKLLSINMFLLVIFQVKSDMVIISLRKATKGEWSCLTGTEKKLKDSKE